MMIRGRAISSAISVLLLVPLFGQSVIAQELQDGDPEIGKALFMERHCHACHGFTGETAIPLVPLLPKQAFVTIVRTPPMERMPAYPDLSVQQVAHIYAYLEELPTTSPSLEGIPLLNEIRSELESSAAEEAQ